MFDAGQDVRWWLRDSPAQEDLNAHKKLIPVAERIRDVGSVRSRNNEVYAALYGSVSPLGLSTRASARPAGTNLTLSLNITRNIVNTIVSKIAAKARPKVTFLTEGGDFEDQRVAERLDKGVDGVFYSEKFNAKARAWCRDALVFGTGLLRVYPDYDERRVCIDRAPAQEVLVDEAEARYGEPRSTYYVKYYDKLVLKELFPESADEIEACDFDRDDSTVGAETTAQQLLVYEAWHLPSSKESTDGRRVIAIKTATLLDEEWKGRRFPFAKLSWNEPLYGWYGDGVCSELAGIQAEINKLVQQIQKGHHLITGHYLIENGSKVVVGHINNDLSSLLRYTGTPPTYQTPAIISPEIYQHLWNLVSRGYELSGLSQTQATSQKPAGLNSGVAIREYNDMQTERFLDFGQRFEEAVLDAASLVLHAAKELTEDGPYEVRTIGERGFETVNWQTLPDPDGYEMKVFPTSQLPGTPAGKIQFAQDMLSLGVFDPEDMLEIINFPDTKSISDLRMAPRKSIERDIARMAHNGEPVTPEPLQDLHLGMRLATYAYLKYKDEGISEEKQELLRRYIQACKDMMPPPPPPPAPPMPMPPALGAPPVPPAPGVAPPMTPPDGVQPIPGAE